MAFAGELGIAVFGGSALAGFGLLRVLSVSQKDQSFSTISKTNANWAAPKERGVLSALGLIGVPLGALITAPIVSGFLTVANWRILFVLLGILGLVCYGLGKGFTDYPEDNKKVSEEELDEIRSTEDSLNVEKTVETEDASENGIIFSKVQHLSGI